MSYKIKRFFKKVFGTLPAWERTDDMIGHKATFPVRCKMCRGKFGQRPKMILRNSNVLATKKQLNNKEIKQFVVRQNWKCPRCDWVCAFLILEDKEYVEHLLEKRGGVSIYYPGIEEWSKNRYAKKKLESLGYL